jgi:hypothetical protein
MSALPAAVAALICKGAVVGESWLFLATFSAVVVAAAALVTRQLKASSGAVRLLDFAVFRPPER